MIRSLAKLDLWQVATLPHSGRIQGPKSPSETELNDYLKRKILHIIAKLNEHITFVAFWKVFLYPWVNCIYTSFFCDKCLLHAFAIYIDRGFYATMKGNECGNFYINKKFLIFFKNGKFFYVFFKSCTSLRKSTEFKLLRHFVHNFNETPSWDQDHILHPSPLPIFSACTFHCCYLKSSIYACCELFHIYQNYDKGVINACCSNYHVILSY